MLKQFLFSLVLAAGIVAASNAAGNGFAPQSSNEREIKLTVVPKNIRAEAKTWDFEVALETHTRDLNEDLLKSSRLITGGKEYLPLRWEGAPPGGHHRKGLLRFEAIAPLPASVELQIRLQGDVSSRSFKWMLK